MSPTEIAETDTSLRQTAWENLRNCQRQLDQDGCEVGVSRQALDETLDALSTAQARIEKLEGDLYETWTDDYGTGWTRPTGWAYAQVCKARDKQQARAEAAEAALQLLKGAGDFAWVIEAPGQHYLATRDIGHHPEFFWTKDHLRAVRFISAAQADGVMMAVRRMAPELWAFALNLGEAKPVEHGWLNALPQPPAQQPDTRAGS